jgi:hypothetical protein
VRLLQPARAVCAAGNPVDEPIFSKPDHPIFSPGCATLNPAQAGLDQVFVRSAAEFKRDKGSDGLPEMPIFNI